MCITCWIPKATDTHSEYLILIAFALLQWLYESAKTICYTQIVCIVFFCVNRTKHVSMLCGKFVFHLFMIMQRHCQQLRPDYCRKIRPLMNNNLAGRGRGLL
jgi:hypothetical protein